uniref:Chemokine interleukin-8-like domain-containing protein n=1 Tax=Periophthalmus magnuspinnatus TaxID=409849 RepID=A0A3B4A2V7_9GOBI
NMAARFILFVLLLGIASISLTLRGPGPKRCCFEFTKFVSERKVMGYRRTPQQCSNAGVLKMRNGLLCAKPSEPWVKELMQQCTFAPGRLSM